jgi:glucose-1-phosphate thymidylyltransferase
MKGVILAGGTGSRLRPLTKVTNKHLLPVYNKPMIYYPIRTLKQAGITDILIVSGKGHAGDFLELLGSGSELGVNLSYDVQDNAGGIAEALGLAADYARGEKLCVVLGDNIIFDDIFDSVREFEEMDRGAKIFLKSVPNPRSYGVAEVDDGRIVKIIEKPTNPPSNLAVIGLYMYDPQVFDVINGLSPSERGELEITDVNNFYIAQGTMTFDVLESFWGDCGESFDSLKEACNLVAGSDLALVDGFFNVGKVSDTSKITL